jgi:hypothetical protein
MSAIWGAEKAMLEYPQVKAGIILMMDRTFTVKQNEIMLNKAIQYQPQGIIGMDLAGPNHSKFQMKKITTFICEGTGGWTGIDGAHWRGRAAGRNAVCGT